MIWSKIQVVCQPFGHCQSVSKPSWNHQPDGNPVHKDFSELEKINGYLPQVRVPGYAFPLLMCDIDDVGVDLIGWEDHFNPQNAYDMNNMIFDVPRMRDFKRKQLLERLNKGGDMVDDLNDFVADLEGKVRQYKNNDADMAGDDLDVLLDTEKGREMDELRSNLFDSVNGVSQIGVDQSIAPSHSGDEQTHEDSFIGFLKYLTSLEDDNEISDNFDDGSEINSIDVFLEYLKFLGKEEGAQQSKISFENPCFHIVKHYPPAKSNKVKYKPGEFRKKMLLVKEH